MEHRYNKRFMVEFSVMVIARDHGVRIGTARNLGLEGMYITVPNGSMPLGTMLKLKLRVNSVLETMRAVVVHRDQDGIGVFFRDQEPMRRAGWHRIPALLDEDGTYWMDVG
jgi:hypothetical protein